MAGLSVQFNPYNAVALRWGLSHPSQRPQGFVLSSHLRAGRGDGRPPCGIHPLQAGNSLDDVDRRAIR